MAEKENQHYIPQCYLRGFTIADEKSLIWEYDKETGLVSREPRSVRRICVRNLYYAQNDEQGRMDRESVEDALQKLECKVAGIIGRIRGLRDGQRVDLAGDDHGTLSFFVALLLTRVPSFRDGIEEMHRTVLHRMLGPVVEHSAQEGRLPAPIKELYDKGQLLEAIEVSVNPQISLRPMAQLAGLGGEALLNKLWSFALPASEMFFVTGDNPVCFQLPERFRGPQTGSIGPFHPLSEVTVPLRKDLALVCEPSVGYSEGEFHQLLQEMHLHTIQLDGADTENINKRTALACKRFVYAPKRSSALARMVGELKGFEQRVHL